jgi:hypothetical protein
MNREVDGAGVRTIANGGRDPSRDRGRERHRILRELRHELERHPAVAEVRGVPGGKFREPRAELDPVAFDRNAEHASFRVSWWPTPEDPEFAFHYSDSTGFDCGWHREPNPHVEGKAHYQERRGSGDTYEYEAVTFSTTNPSRLLWHVLERLSERLERH